MGWFNNLSVKYKIGCIALIGILGLFTSFMANIYFTGKVETQINHTVEKQLPTLQFINELQLGFVELKELYQSALFASDLDILDEAKDKARELRSSFYEARRINNDADFEELFDQFDKYIEVTTRATELAITDINSEEAQRGFEEMNRLRESYEGLQNKFVSDWYEGFEGDMSTLQQTQGEISGVGAVILLLVTILLFAISVMIIRLITRVLDNAVNVADKIAGGELDQEIEVETEDESGKLMSALRQMRDALFRQQEETRLRDDLQSALAGLNETMRGDKDIDELSKHIIEYLAETTKSAIGAMYLLEGGALTLKSSFAFNYRSGNTNQYKIGESIVGQCALEKKTFVVTDLPNDYVKVSSGVGQAVPSSLLVFPIELEGELLGVVELGSFRQFNDQDLSFVERGRDGLGIAINSAGARVRMAEMLDQTRRQADELQTQQKEMEIINGELQARSKALDVQKNEILQKNNELERSKKVLVEKSQALEASDKYKTQFLSTMSHELRTPLNSILILSQALIENKKGNLSDKEVQHAHVIHSSGSDLLTLINDILDLSKIEEGKLDMVYEEASFESLSAELTKRFEYVAGDKGLDFKVTIEDGLPEGIVTDTHRLNQVIKNFISNAIKFTDKGGIYIDFHKPRDPFVPVHSGLTNDNSFVLAVRDTGVGIPKDKQNIIFEAFKQADGTTSRKYGGTGLGLTISRELAELLGGEISVYSDGEGNGSIFYLILPYDSESNAPAIVPGEQRSVSKTALFEEDSVESAPVAEQSAPAVSSDSSTSSMADDEKAKILAMYESGGGDDSPVDFSNQHFLNANRIDRILIVEDDEKFAAILNDLIVEAGLQCDLVYTGEDACTYLELYQPQAVILDISLPDLSGWEVLQRIKSSSRVGNTPVHIVSAMPEREQAIDLGAEDFTEKPVSQNDVQDLLGKIKEEIGDSFSRVVLVEDNISLHDAIKEQFSDKGIDIEVAATGQDGIELIKQVGFDCLIVDLMLPDMDGIELLREVRSQADFAEKPVIVFTAQEMSTEREFEISKYADRVIIKSGQGMDRLVGTVSKFLSDVSTNSDSAIKHATEVLQQSATNSLTEFISELGEAKQVVDDKALLEGQEAVKSEPAASEPPSEAATAPVAPMVDYDDYEEGMLEGCKVLLVDDDIRNIYSLSSVLEINGMEVTTAMSGMEALDKLTESLDKTDVVLMDIMMPEMDGYEAMRRIREMENGRAIPIIALTAKAMKEDRDLCIQAGASDYISKPVDTDLLNQAIVTWVKGSASQ